MYLLYQRIFVASSFITALDTYCGWWETSCSGRTFVLVPAGIADGPLYVIM